MKDPATASWGLSISHADFVKLKRGFRPREMEDRWIFKTMTDEEVSDEAISEEEMTDEELIDESLTDEAMLDLDQGGNISIRRRWTDKGIYRLAVKPNEGGAGATIEAITWERSQGDRVSEEEAKIDAVILCRLIVKCESAAAPDYDRSLFSALPPSVRVAMNSTTVQNGTT
ncbi:hypothetical protein VP1G_06764 [Cytospora mali]|uniref:Uncharacterized protein n=1 Tax=Cytospora mali TaxID=578113 RepID=A0A194V6G5_CYTMA|nr:hypothetical protein VP1G_06764 [Valsa mali var. pyri (nom. inval.)]